MQCYLVLQGMLFAYIVRKIKSQQEEVKMTHSCNHLMNDLCSHFATNFIFIYMELVKHYVQNTIKWNESQSIWGGTFPIPQMN